MDSGNFDRVFALCVEHNCLKLDKKNEAMRFKKLAEQCLGLKDFSKAQKFALKSLEFNDDSESVKELLDQIKEAQSNAQNVIIAIDDAAEEKSGGPQSVRAYDNSSRAALQSPKAQNNQNDWHKSYDVHGTKGNGNDELINQVIEQSTALQQLI